MVFAKDITFKDYGTWFPEQHGAFDADGNYVGYVRVRNGYCETYCPDCVGEVVYAADLPHACGGFGSNKERKKHLRRIKACIAAWCNEHPGVCGKCDDCCYLNREKGGG